MPDPAPAAAYRSLVAELKDIATLESVAAVLHWDERTQMPPRGGAHRAEQSSMLARMAHERLVSPQMGELLAAVEASPLVADADGDATVNVRQARRRYDRARKLPTSLVEELTKTAVLGEQAWETARAKSDFPAFEPWLAKMLELKRQEAACVGFASNPYDALLDEYEPGETAEGVQRTFEALRGPLVELVRAAGESSRKAPDLLRRRFPVAAQERLARDAAAAVGFDFEAGRLDVSVHPFCTDLGPGDTRMTTRYDEHDFVDAFFGVLHETGHALYSQGLPAEHFGTPRGSYVSLGIHESQSRTWENLVGRSRAFWRFFLPRARAAFPEALGDVDDDAWYFAVNAIRPSLVRTEADEATYNLHVMLRFELEQAMLRDEIKAADVPAAWGERMRDYLGLTPPDDARGCLQDVHWSGGAIGYFPTYTLGNLYAAQFFEQARTDLGDLDASFAAGEFRPLLDWLRRHVHAHGQRHTARELVRRATGSELSAEPLLRHLRGKAAELYGVG
jgi:carboxypeptidase Taq